MSDSHSQNNNMENVKEASLHKSPNTQEDHLARMIYDVYQATVEAYKTNPEVLKTPARGPAVHFLRGIAPKGAQPPQAPSIGVRKPM
jgi:hypothetical protein